MTESMSGILPEAERIFRERAEKYGDIVRRMETIAALWSAYLWPDGSKCIRGSDAAMTMALMKIGRQVHNNKPDNLIDVCGYMEGAARCTGVTIKDQGVDNE